MVCTGCQVDKPPSEYFADKRRPFGKRKCKDCQRETQRKWRASKPTLEKERYAKPGEKDKMRERHLRRKYGISLATYQVLLQSQSGGCAICAKPEPIGRMLDVDHDHATGEVRGLLCQNCNRMLGYAYDDTARLARAIDYLSRRSRQSS